MDERDCALSHPARVARRLYETMKGMKSMKALKAGVSWPRGLVLGENGKGLLEKGRCFSLHALRALRCGKLWRKKGGDFLPRRSEGAKKGRRFTTKARRQEDSGFLQRSAGRRLANLGALCGFVVQTLPLWAGRVWVKGRRLWLWMVTTGVSV